MAGSTTRTKSGTSGDIITDGVEETEEVSDEDHDYSLNGLHLSEGTWENLQQAKWTRFDSADEGHGGIVSIARDIAKKRARERPDGNPSQNQRPLWG